MNKKYTQLVPLVIFAAVAIFIIIIVAISSGRYNQYRETIDANKNDKSTIEQHEKEISDIEIRQEAENKKLKTLKPIYESQISSSTESMSIYGSMFEDVIKKAQTNGLMIRSIEYNMEPDNDPLISDYSDTYNACELKFFLVGTYSQLQSFLVSLNDNYEHLMYISRLNVTAFSANTDYLLIDTAITIYSKKTAEEQKRNRTKKRK